MLKISWKGWKGKSVQGFKDQKFLFLFIEILECEGIQLRMNFKPFQVCCCCSNLGIEPRASQVLSAPSTWKFLIWCIMLVFALLPKTVFITLCLNVRKVFFVLVPGYNWCNFPSKKTFDHQQWGWSGSDCGLWQTGETLSDKTRLGADCPHFPGESRCSHSHSSTCLC